MKTIFAVAAGLAGILLVLSGQQPDIGATVSKNVQLPAIAIPDFKGAGDAQKLMGTLNDTLSSDVTGSGRYKVAPKSMYPLNVPQQASDFVTTPNAGGRNLADWSGPPVNAQYL